MGEQTGGAGRRGIAIFYAVLTVAAAVTLILAFSAGSGEDAEPGFAGGWAARGGGPCLDTFTIEQSGRFVNLEGPGITGTAKLESRDGEITGDVDCSGVGSRPVRLVGGEGRMRGELGARPVMATLESDPPTPGALTPVVPRDVAGDYKLAPTSTCLGGSFELSGKGEDVELEGTRATGHLRFDSGEGTLKGPVRCDDGRPAALVGTAADRALDIQISGGAAPPEHVTAAKQREFGLTVGAFFLAVAVVMLVARLFGAVAVRIAQPRVMGEVVAGIALGPTILGAVSPHLQAAIFPTDIIPLIGVAANLGLIFYMFLVGLELDPALLRGRLGAALAISNASIAMPLALGAVAALPIYTILAPDINFAAFALFMGVAMSITAFPVLARILVERRMLKRPVGAIAMAAAAIDDVTAWFLIALATAVATAGSGIDVVKTIGLALAFVAVMFVVIRPMLARVSTAYDEAGRVPGGWIVAIFAGVLLCAVTTETIGIALIFGAFVMGLVMPRHAGLTEDVTGRIEDFVVVLLLPLFFAYTGLRTNVGLLDRPELWLITIGLIVVAITGKMAGAFIAARVTGFGVRASGVIGTLMNTRGLTELIVLNLALEKGVISSALFASLVLMALATTFMAGPLLALLDPGNKFGQPVEEELEVARALAAEDESATPPPERSILVAPQSDGALAQLVALSEPLADSEPKRELILARLLPPPRSAAAGVRGGLQTESLMLAEATAQLDGVRAEMRSRGTAARTLAFISSQAAHDLDRLLGKEEVDLVITDGRRPLLGGGVPRGDVGSLLENAPCDVAVLVSNSDGVVTPGPSAPVVVPFGGAEHDWAALELGAWMASAMDAPLKLMGAAGDTDEGARVSRLLADAGLLIQRFAGVSSEPLITEPGRDAVVAAARGAGLLVIGLSERWREEGLGETRSEIASAAPAPVLFVRRGSRVGALAPKEDFTRFTWSAPGFTPTA